MATIMADGKAENLLESAKWHKAHCEDPECNVSLYLIGLVYQDLVGRGLTPSELAVFM